MLHAPQNQAAIAQIETLDLRSLGLQILPPEINLFTGLDDLDLCNNQITEINDLHGLSNLTVLDVYGNGLEEINLSGLSSLDILVLNSGNKLSELNLSGLTNLETLYIGSNPELTELDLDGLEALKMIYVDEIQETKYAEGDFVLKNHPNLEAIEVTSNI